MQCMRKDCSEEAKWQLGWKVWAEGHPKTSLALIGRVGLAICDDHLQETLREGVKSFMTKDTFARINQYLQQAGKLNADFSQAEVTYEEIIDGKLYMPGDYTFKAARN